MSSDYIAHLEHQHRLLGDFLALLGREQTILTTAPIAIDALSDITEAKRDQATKLESLEEQRRRLVALLSDTLEAGSDRALAQRLDCAALWQAFVARVAEARTQNELNGLAIHTRLDHTERTLGFLRRSASQSLYAADGRRSGVTHGRIHQGV